MPYRGTRRAPWSLPSETRLTFRRLYPILMYCDGARVVSSAAPPVSVGLPVRNGMPYLPNA